jgi:hypothetical protein
VAALINLVLDGRPIRKATFRQVFNAAERTLPPPMVDQAVVDDL